MLMSYTFSSFQFDNYNSCNSKYFLGILLSIIFLYMVFYYFSDDIVFESGTGFSYAVLIIDKVLHKTDKE